MNAMGNLNIAETDGKANPTASGSTRGGTPPVTGNSSDFVKKLYKMLEDPAHASIVRWGDGQDSFVVLECEKFTKYILPKHFKHSNFASFVRQLNKYDFHKVRQNPDENGQSQYGANAWEFKHPEFKANNKDSLENIRRKAPAPRKTSADHDTVSIQQYESLNQQVMVQSQQIQTMANRCSQVALDNQTMAEELRRVQRTALAHDTVLRYVLSHLEGLQGSKKRRKTPNGTGEVNSRPASVVFPSNDETASKKIKKTPTPPVPPEEGTEPLAQAKRVLSSLPLINLNSMQNVGIVNIPPLVGVQNSTETPIPKISLPSEVQAPAPAPEQPSSEAVSSPPPQPQIEHASLNGTRETRPPSNPQTMPYPSQNQIPQQTASAPRMANGGCEMMYPNQSQVMDNVGTQMYPQDSVNGYFPLPSQATPAAVGPPEAQSSLLHPPFPQSKDFDSTMHASQRASTTPATINGTSPAPLLQVQGGNVNGSASVIPQSVTGNMAYNAYTMPQGLGISPVPGAGFVGMGGGMPIGAAGHPGATIASSTPSNVPGQFHKRHSASFHTGWTRSPRILLVEDDITCCQVGCKFLQGFQCQVDVAEDGYKAVEKIHQQGLKYDLILMDIIMPVLDGVATCTILRRTELTPIIAMTSNIRQTDIDMYYSSGMNDVLPKPFARDTLLSMLRKYLMHFIGTSRQIEATVPTKGVVE